LREEIHVIASREELASKLALADISGLAGSAESRAKVVDLSRKGELDRTLLFQLIEEVPELAKEYCRVIGAMADYGKSLEETKRLRWRVLADLAKRGKLNSEQILEAMRILKDIEAQEQIPWVKIFAGAFCLTLGTVALIFHLKNRE
jgi:ERCC4-type nuclease